MAWCHRCRVESPDGTDGCPECGGALVAPPPPERRLNASLAEAEMVVLDTLPPEEALLASGRLDAGGIPSALRDVTAAGSIEPLAVQLLVPPTLVARARAVLAGRLRRRPRGGAGLGTFLFVVATACVLLSGVIVAVRWILTGTPLPR